MFQSFTGQTRRPRQVNLSGRPTNPFATTTSSPFGARPSTPGHNHHHPGPKTTLAHVQRERAERQAERARISAAKRIQRVYRGYVARQAVKDECRRRWDGVEVARGPGYEGRREWLGLSIEGAPTRGYEGGEEMVGQLRVLLFMVETWCWRDAVRLAYFGECWMVSPGVEGEVAGEYEVLLRRFAGTVLRFLSVYARASSPPPSVIDSLLRTLIALADAIPGPLASKAPQFYTTMLLLTHNFARLDACNRIARDNLITCITSPLRPLPDNPLATITAYESFARTYLTTPDLDSHLRGLPDLALATNYKILGRAMLDRHLRTWTICTDPAADEPRLWLLAHYIYIHHHATGTATGGHRAAAPDATFAAVVSTLIGSASSDFATRLAPPAHGKARVKPLPPFVQTQLEALMSQHGTTNLLSQAQGEGEGDGDGEEGAQALASYALTLLTLFPRRADEVRMWLYLGSASVMQAGRKVQVPAIIYFWHAARQTAVFRGIMGDEAGDRVLGMLLPLEGEGQEEEKGRRDREWTVILLFLELYTFLLKVLDDEEFFSAGSVAAGIVDPRSVSWTRESALPLGDVRDLTVFLKNLAFTLYWNVKELTADSGERERVEAGSLSNYFSGGRPRGGGTEGGKASGKARRLPGVTDVPLDYLKGLVTGLLRMVHERDSRRKFLRDGHWLMTDRFDMEGFIPAVVAEEEKRLELQDEDSEEEDIDPEEADEEAADDDDYDTTSYNLIGTSQTQQHRHHEHLRRAQAAYHRTTRLESVIAPRLEILRNMPFFLPFTTRVQIFREFVRRDQERRRGRDTVQPDAWRLAMAQAGFSMGRSMPETLARHHADIQRGRVLDDAFEQFYELGEGLKEPIHISFIDRFGGAEAGIDGGGVTKEFLTSVINEAFDTRAREFGDGFFLENEEHLLFPNPTLVEQRKEMVRQMGMREGSAQYVAQIRDLLKRYEFLGRIIGKCLYEGILVDVRFAGFFLLKWALTGGTSSAKRESAYRANLNDLRDLDQGLYQGLLQLKNYPGDVEELGVNFTIDDTFTIPDIAADGRVIQKTITKTRDLKPGGSEIPVTNQNRLVYISYVARHRLQVQPFYQTQAFLQGLGQIIQPSWLSMFNQAELQTLVGGDAGVIDIEDLRRNTIFSGVYAIGDDGVEHPTTQMFWEVLHEMSNGDRAKLLKFVTSTPRAPLLGFSHLNPRFSIRDSSSEASRLPSASTCANLLKLPIYRDKETLREKLSYAINAEAGFDLS